MTSAFPAQRASNAEMFPFDDVIMTKMHVICEMVAVSLGFYGLTQTAESTEYM